MKAKIDIELEPFAIPHFVRQSENQRAPGAELAVFPLSAIDAEAIEGLCDQFRKDVFAKAGKRDPDFDRPRSA